MQGQWVIVDTDSDNNAIRLLQDGQKRYLGKSVRKNLTKEQRVLLLQRLENAALHGAESDELHAADGVDYRVRVRPVLSPFSRIPVGAIGTYVKVDKSLPIEPRVGALEWHIEESRTIYWNPELVDIYGMERADLSEVVHGEHKIFMPTQEWLTGWIDPADQDKLQRLIENAANGEFHGVVQFSYRIVNPSTGVSKIVELAAGNRQRDDGVMLYLGMVREVAEQAESRIPDELTEPVPQIDALIELTADIPLAQIRADTGEAVQVFPGWENAGLPSLARCRLSDLVPPERRDGLMDVLGRADQEGPVVILDRMPLQTAQGDWIIADMWVKSLGEGYVMLRVKFR